MCQPKLILLILIETLDKDQEMENNKTFYTVDINIDFKDLSIFYELVILDINSMICTTLYNTITDTTFINQLQLELIPKIEYF